VSAPGDTLTSQLLAGLPGTALELRVKPQMLL
jgi:hypothetical protein